MSKLLAGIDMGAMIRTYLQGEPLVLRQFTDGGPSADINAGIVRIPVEYSCTGYPQAVEMSKVDKTLMRNHMIVFGIYADSLEVKPQVNDEIDYDNYGECWTFVIYHIESDSVDAVWVAYACAKTG